MSDRGEARGKFLKTADGRILPDTPENYAMIQNERNNRLAKVMSEGMKDPNFQMDKEKADPNNLPRESDLNDAAEKNLRERMVQEADPLLRE